MGTFTRARSSRQRRHPASRSASHQQDKAKAERRNGVVFVRVPAPARPSPERPFEAHGLTGHEFTYDGRDWHRCQEPEEFADHLDTEGRRRDWFIDETTRHGKPVRMRRPAATPVEVVTVTFAPWLSEWTLAELRDGRDPRPVLAAIRNRWIERTCDRFDGQRYVLGFAFHGDTSDLHFDFCVSRQDGTGGRIGSAGLLLVGPWCVGTDRQLRAGAEISPRKQRQLSKSVQNFRRRYGEETKPLDVQLARDLDEIAEAEIGPALAQFRAAYAAQVPALEREHAAAELAALDAARAQLSPQKPEPAPTPRHAPPSHVPRPPSLDLGR